jgi:hypothetical protein
MARARLPNQRGVPFSENQECFLGSAKSARRTFTMMYAMVFGTLDQALSKAQALRRVHRKLLDRSRKIPSPLRPAHIFTRAMPL